ncbi:ABC transporter permease [Streptomyces gibsoniae]|uniref:Transport permease protein n=1 Tax=Streptomyces gibsoniae TaxID=3075529 RepID=A0ABU2U0A1_9ACTN|nr:ABC transporter permease [Streptomyces sp. DSM 41699]MDT0466634.1 ABC transporter permease [Streptomyces sp. DSM 41699]
MSAYAALTRATYVASVRDKTTLFFTFAFPLAFLVLFGLIFHGQEVKGGLSSINYIAPGVLSWGVGNACVFSVGFALMQWRRDDLLRLIWRTPTPLRTLLASRWTVALAVACVQTVLFTGVALLPFFGLHVNGPWWAVVPLLVLGVTAFIALGLIVGSVANTPEAVAAIANILMVPMAFLSGSFFPDDLMPGWLRTVAKVLPLHYLNDGLTDAMGGRGDLGDIAVDCAGLAVFGVVFGLIATRIFRWSNRT